MNHTSTPVSSALTGTKTLTNLRHAFEKEAELFAKASVYSSFAESEGNSSAKRTLSEQADNSKHHAELWLGYLDELGDVIENLGELSQLNDIMENEIYPFMAETADEEGLSEIGEKMRLMASVKKTHKQELEQEKQRAKRPESLISDDPETIWHCTCCGYNIKGNSPPERCPLCSYPASFYARI